MIYITGDTHGYYDKFEARFKNIDLTADDTVIICGDFGFIFGEDRTGLEQLKNFPCCVLFVDGNHENFPEIFSYPEEEWHGGKIHRIAPGIIHLMRGQTFEICGKTFFAMGGAYSIDRGWRIRGTSWWDEELPSGDEYKTASETLSKCNNKVDYILTHDAPSSMIMQMGFTQNLRGGELTGYLEWVKRTVAFDKWFFGHYHAEYSYDDKFFCMYENVIALV